jgi:hypothetical protein
MDPSWERLGHLQNLEGVKSHFDRLAIEDIEDQRFGHLEIHNS